MMCVVVDALMEVLVGVLGVVGGGDKVEHLPAPQTRRGLRDGNEKNTGK